MATDPLNITINPAALADIPELLELINGYASQHLMLPRTADDIRERIGNFIVARTVEGRLAGTVALRDYDNGLFEVRSLAVAEFCVNSGVGSRLVEALIEKARAQEPPAKCVFVLTKHPALFRRLNFRDAKREEFPAKIWADCRLCPKFDCCDETALAYS